MRSGLLRLYIREVLGAADPWSTGKDMHAGNLYSTGNGSMGAPIRRTRGNVLDDERNEQEMNMQGKMLAACCLIMSDDGKVLAVSRKDDPTAFGMPGGKVDPGETPEGAAARELQEETGLIARNLRLVFVRREDDGFTTYTYACDAEGEIDTDESGAVRWVDPEVLFNGPFGGYNRRLWAKLGLKPVR